MLRTPIQIFTVEQTYKTPEALQHADTKTTKKYSRLEANLPVFENSNEACQLQQELRQTFISASAERSGTSSSVASLRLARQT